MDVHVALRDRIGFSSTYMRNLYRIVFPFFHCKCQPSHRLIHSKEPVVLVCNHYEIFGPLAVVTSLPMRFRFWSNDEAVHPADHVDRLFPALRKILPFLSVRQARALFLRVCPVLASVYRQLDPIIVRQNSPREIITTMRDSVSALMKGESILIFPEDGIPSYAIGGINSFVEGFAMVGEFYRRKTGKDLHFIPMYVDKYRRQIHFGEDVVYSTSDPTGESQRVSQALHRQMTAMAARAGH